MSRYKGTPVFDNSGEYYEYLRRRRDLKSVTHYATPIMAHPTITGRSRLVADKYVWGYGDRFYNLAHKYYGDPQYWWVIAWYNKRPTESHVKIGDVVRIPTPLDKVLNYMRI